MVNYTCPRCNFTTHIKTKYTSHLRRKYICENILSDDNLESEYIKYNIIEKMSNISSAKKPPKTAKIKKPPPNSAKIRQNLEDSSEDSFECKYCDKIFTRKDSLIKHLNGRCKMKKELDNEKNEMYKIVEMLNQQLIDKDEKINELIKNSGNTTNITYNQQNNINTNIKLLGYRNTDISHLSDKDFISCISHSNFCIPHLIKKIHFDPDKPENHNIYISNIKNNYAMLYDGDKWNLTNKDDLINEILEEKEIIIEEKLEEWVEKGKQYPEIMKKFTRYLEKKENDAVLDKIKDEVKLVLFNNRNLIKN